jgi:branched-chain amino acid transport system permease protein
MPDKYVIMRLKEGQDKYSVMAVSGDKGTPPRVVDDKIYENLNEAYHAVFLLRVNDLLES